LNIKVTGYSETAVSNFNNNNNNIVIFIILYNNLNFLDAFAKQLRLATVSFGSFLRRHGTKAPPDRYFHEISRAELLLKFVCTFRVWLESDKMIDTSG
jgi:hypothetical protein